MRLPEINEIQVRRANQVLLASMEMCPFCKKVLDTNHLNNKNHLAYMKEHLQSHYMLGPRLRDDFRGGQRNPKPQTLNPFLVLHRVRAGERAP